MRVKEKERKTTTVNHLDLMLLDRKMSAAHIAQCHNCFNTMFLIKEGARMECPF